MHAQPVSPFGRASTSSSFTAPTSSTHIGRTFSHRKIEPLVPIGLTFSLALSVVLAATKAQKHYKKKEKSQAAQQQSSYGYQRTPPLLNSGTTTSTIRHQSQHFSAREHALSIESTKTTEPKQISSSNRSTSKPCQREIKARERTRTIARQHLRDEKNAYRDSFFVPEPMLHLPEKPSRVKKTTPIKSQDEQLVDWMKETLQKYNIDVRAFAAFDPSLFSAKSVTQYERGISYYDGSDFDYSKLLPIYKEYFKFPCNFNEFIALTYPISNQSKEIAFILESLREYDIDLLLFASFAPLYFDNHQYLFNEFSHKEGLLYSFNYLALCHIYEVFFRNDPDFLKIWLKDNAGKRYLDIDTPHFVAECYDDSTDEELSSMNWGYISDSTNSEKSDGSYLSDEASSENEWDLSALFKMDELE